MIGTAFSRPLAPPSAGAARTEPYIISPLPHCSILVDRHVHKNGGTTMRGIMLENDQHDGWAYWGYGLNHMREVAAAATRLLSSMANGSCRASLARSPLRIALLEAC